MTAELENSPRFRHFDWEKSKTFYYISKLGSFTNAARFLNMSQPALSRQISSLEQQLGCPLFTRQSRGLKLTRKGEELVSILENIFLDLKGFTHSTHVKTDNGQKRKIKIATTHAIAAYIINDLLIDYNLNHPHLIFDVIGNDQLIDITLNDVDIAIRPLNELEHNALSRKKMQREYLFSLEKKLYASVEYLEKYGVPQTVKDLRHHRVIAISQPEEHPYADVNWILRLGMPEEKLHDPVYTSTTVECLISVAKRGLGIIASYEEMSVLRDAKLKNILPDIKCKPLKEYILYPNYLKEDLEIIKLKEYLSEKLSLFSEN